MLSQIALLLPAWGWLIISVSFYAVGEFVSKTWANSPSATEVALVVIANGLSALFWLPALFSQNKLVDVGISWLVLAAVATLIIGIGFFGERLSVAEWSGVGLALLAFILMMFH